ncbi:hypothetical protein [Variovorax sp. WS11]|nr:hypothetical protein [Variovorax sp. WS11]
MDWLGSAADRHWRPSQAAWHQQARRCISEAAADARMHEPS